jgi:hypothetical protein
MLDAALPRYMLVDERISVFVSSNESAVRTRRTHAKKTMKYIMNCRMLSIIACFLIARPHFPGRINPGPGRIKQNPVFTDEWMLYAVVVLFAPQDMAAVIFLPGSFPDPLQRPLPAGDCRGTRQIASSRPQKKNVTGRLCSRISSVIFPEQPRILASDPPSSQDRDKDNDDNDEDQPELVFLEHR